MLEATSVKIVAATAVAFVGTLCLTPLARAIAYRLNAVDRPDGQRKLQRKPVALLGGVAVLGGLAVTVMGAAAFGALTGSRNSIIGVAISLGLVCLAGVIDDLRNLRPHWKLAAQLAAVVPLLWTGYQIKTIAVGGWSVELGSWGILATVVWVIVCTNAINLIDGMDGLCATVALCVVLGVVAIGTLAGAMHTVICAAALAGALLGFLVYNLPPASIYLGDAGSMVIGMTLSLLTLRIAKLESGETHPIVLVTLMAIPLADVLLAIARRIFHRQPIWSADRGHIHHRLLASGRSVKQSLGVIATTCLACSLIAALAFQLRSPALAVGGLIALATVTVRAKWIGHQEWAMLQDYLMVYRLSTTANPEVAEEALGEILPFPAAVVETSADADTRRRAA